MYGMENYVTFDLSMSGTYGYYTGIVFRGYTYGTGDAIVKGGRYDRLLDKFGKDEPSIGFAIVADELMNALARQKIHVPVDCSNTVILYEKSREKEAIAFAQDCRRDGKNTELLLKQPENSIEDYKDYGRKHMASGLIWLQEDGGIWRTEL